MRLTWITNLFPPDKGGMSTSAGRIVHTLRDRGHSVTVVRLSSPEDADTVNSVSAGNENPALITSTGDHERIFFSLRRSLEGTTLIGFGGDMPAYLAVLWGKWLGTKSVALFRGNDLDRLLHDARRAWLVHFVLANADMAGAVATEMVARIKTLRDKPTVFTPNSIDTEDWAVFEKDRDTARRLREQHNTAERKVIGVFGQLKHKKGVDLAMDILEYPPLQSRPFLMTVGDVAPPLSDVLTERLNGSWISVPYQKREELAAYYLACDAVLIPSYYDGMPNVLLEAMAMGVPVVASRAGGIPDVIESGKDGFLFETGNIDEAADQLNRCLALKEEDKNLIVAAASRKIASQFAPSREAEVLERMFGHKGA
jgi:glycosyltransferase involved in cell wall biosynthesis